MSKLHYLPQILAALCACGLLSACGNPAKPPATPAMQVPSDEKIEIPAPVEAEPSPPSTQTPPTNPIADEATLTPDLHARFTRGLTLDEARALTTVPALRAGGDGKATEIYRWTDKAGTSFTARFDGGALTTKSSLLSPRAPGNPSPREKESPPVDVNTMPVAQIAPGVYIPLDRAITSATDQPLGATEMPSVPDATPPSKEGPAAKPPDAPSSNGPTIAIAGAARRAREAAQKTSSYHPRAALPDFSRALEEGSFEIRFLNPSDSPANAGLRQDKLGKNIVVPPMGKASIKVNRGVYQLYFLRDNDPNTLFEAKPITIDGFQATDVEVTLDPDNVEVHLIDYSKPGE